MRYQSPNRIPGVIIQQMDRKLQKLAKESECPKSYFIKKALELYLQEYEDYQPTERL